MPLRVSLSMIVKDGAETLGRCLESVRTLVDEMIVVDTGSTDGSQAIAESLGAKVHPFVWTDSFADARNASLSHCQAPWIFWLDADEWLAPADQARFQALIDQLPSRETVYLMNQVSPQADPDAGDLNVAQARFVRNAPGLRWRYRVHEQILPSCNALGFVQARLPIAIQHSGYTSESLTLRKEERNRRLLLSETAANPDDTWVLYQLGRIQAREHHDEARLILQTALQKTKADDALRRRIHSLLVEIDMTQGKPEAAWTTVNRALEEIPNDTNLLSHAGRLAFEAGKLIEAEAHFQKLLQTKADADEFLHAVDLTLRGWRTRHNLAVVYHRLGRLREAEALWKANAAEPTEPSYSWLWLGAIDLDEKRWDDLETALQHLEAADDAASLQFKAQARIARDEFPLARSALLQWIALDPRSLPARLLLSRSYIKEGTDLEAAEASLLEVLAIEPNHPEATHNLKAVLSFRADLEADSDDDP